MKGFSGAVFLLVCAVLNYEVAVAEAAEEKESPDRTETIRVKYDKTLDLPDGIAFIETVRVLSALISRGQRTSVEAMIEEELGLSTSESRQLLDHMLAAFEEFRTGTDDLILRMACSRRIVDSEVFSVFAEIDDATDALAQQQLAILKADVGQKIADRVDQWIQVRKLSTVHTKVDYEAHYRQLGVDPNEKVTSLCNRLNSLAR